MFGQERGKNSKPGYSLNGPGFLATKEILRRLPALEDLFECFFWLSAFITAGFIFSKKNMPINKNKMRNRLDKTCSSLYSFKKSFILFFG